MPRFVFAAALGAVFACSSPAAAVDLTKLPNVLGADWKPKGAATPDLVRFSCTTPSCPPSAELSVAINPAPDDARDGVIADPDGTVAGYEKGFKNNPANKACTFTEFKAVKMGEQGSRFEMTGDCPSGLVLKMATLFDKRQPGVISVAASSMDGPRAAGVRAQAVEAISSALSPAR